MSLHIAGQSNLTKWFVANLASILVAATTYMPAAAEEPTFTIQHLTPETALKLASVTLEACRKEGFQVAVAVVDRSGVLQVLLRDRFAGPHTVTVATNKAWTSATFKQDTLSFAKATSDPAHSGPRHYERVVALGGGIPIEAGGTMLGALGVAGAPGGEADDRCAKAGIEAVRGDLEF